MLLKLREHSAIEFFCVTGFDFELWTRRIIADLIEQRMGISLGLTSVGRLLPQMGITPQKPLRRAYERDPVEVRKWV